MRRFLDLFRRPDAQRPLSDLARRVLEHGDRYGDRTALHRRLPELGDWWATHADDDGAAETYGRELERLADA